VCNTLKGGYKVNELEGLAKKISGYISLETVRICEKKDKAMYSADRIEIERGIIELDMIKRVNSGLFTVIYDYIENVKRDNAKS